jgi:integrase/recombinase XerD
MFQKSVYREVKKHHSMSPQFDYLLESFSKYLETLNYSPVTVKNATAFLHEFFTWLTTQNTQRVKDIDNLKVKTYLDYLKHRPNFIKAGSLSASYINKHITTLRWFSRYLQVTGQANLVIKPELLKTTAAATWLTKEEIKALYKVAGKDDNIYNQRDTAMLGVFYGCGLRASEGQALNTGDILFKKGLVYVRKGKNYRERYVPMNPQVKQALKSYIREQRDELLNGSKTNVLLLGRRGKRWTFHGMYQRLQWLKERSNHPQLKEKSFGLHILRHSIATHLLQDGMSLENIALFLGHKSIESTQVYTHIVKDETFMRGS